MLYVKYLIDQQQQYIEFEEEYEYFLNYFVKKFNTNIIYQKKKEPIVSVLNYIEQPEKKKSKIGYNMFVQLVKEDKILQKINFSFKKLNMWKEDYIFVYIIRNLFITYFMLNKDFLYLHGALLNNGDIILGQCNDGKTTLGLRFNNNNQNLKCLCDDGVLVDLKNNLVHPLPHILWENEDQFSDKIVDFNKPLKINKIYILKRGFNQEIKLIDKNEWINKISRCIRKHLAHPFAGKQKNEEVPEHRWWINHIDGLREQTQKRIDQLIQKYFLKFDPLCIITNTNDLTKKFDLIEDKINQP